MRPLIAAVLVTGACAKPRDLSDPYDRPLDNTAYTVRGVQADVSVGGSQTADLAARIGATVGLGERVQVDLNVGQIALGLVNVGARASVFERGPWALALDARLLGTRGRFLWYLPSDLRDDIGDLGIVTVPVGLHATRRIGRRLVLTLGAGYGHSAVGGAFENEAIVLDGSIGTRRLWVRPAVHLALGRFLLEGTVFVPYAVWGVTALDATAELEPGVLAGATSYGWQPLMAGLGASWQLTGEFSLGRTRLRAGVTGSPVAKELGIPLLPTVGVRFRSKQPRGGTP